MTEHVLQRLLFLVLTDAGGEGKTTISLLLEALLTLADEPVGFLDVDEGNYSGSIQLHAGARAATLKTVRWSTSAGAASRMMADHVGSHMIYDTGANMTASGREVTGLFPALQQQAEEAGYRTIAVFPVSTNKPGAVGALIELAKDYPRWESLFVRVNRDGSKAFEEGLDTSKTVDLDYLHPGFIEFVKSSGGLVEAVRNPPPDLSLAADKVAAWMGNFAGQSKVTEIIGGGPAEAVRGFNRKEPLNTNIVAYRVDDVRDDALRYSAKRSAQLAVLEAHGWSADSHREVARRIEAGDL